MQLSDLFQHLKDIAPVSKSDELLVAISGGVDSVVLAHLGYSAGLKVTLAHCNFNLRGKESDRDESLVRQLGESWGINVLVKSFDTSQYATEKKISIQEAARELRYDWFESLLVNQPRFKWLLTAHHSDDNIETLVMNFFRGTGMAGLTGIPPKNGRILRPLLSFNRQQIMQWALDHELSFVEDSSNLKEDYTRNYFRLTILPSIQQVYPEVTKNLLNNIKRFNGIENFYRESVKKVLSKILQPKGEEIYIPIGQLRRYQHTSLLYEMLTPYGFSAGQIEEAWQLLTAQSGAHINSAQQSWRLIVHRNWLILAPEKKEASSYFLIESTTTHLLFSEGTLYLEEITEGLGNFPTDSCHIWLDKKSIQFPLLLRPWKEGDYFYPLGMSKKKKIARFLIDQRKTTTQKEKIWVLETGGRICWVVGERMDERFKVHPSTQSVLSIRLDRK
jgi:tRNA(Ile)-lysidine synthase